jgi:hypothetical protein
MPVARVTQAPPVQVLPEAHARPQAPQFAGSLLTLMQRVPQRVVGVGQVGVPPTQLLAVQVCPSPQRRLQAPQLNTSVVMSMQLDPQVMRGAAHSEVERQVPPEQNWPAVQARVHEPQWAMSVLGSMQTPSQSRRGDGQLGPPPVSTGGTPASTGGTPVSTGGTPVSTGGTPVSPGVPLSVVVVVVSPRAPQAGIKSASVVPARKAIPRRLIGGSLRSKGRVR